MIGRGARWLVLAGAALVVAACGGGSNSCTDVFGGGCAPTTGSSAVSRVTIVLTNSVGAPASSLSNSGTERLTATVTTLDANNAVVADATVAFSVNADAEIAASGNATGADGKLTGSIGIGPNRASRQVTVTAMSGTVSASATFLVVGARLSASVPVQVDPGANFNASYTLVDASGNPMVGEAVTLNSSAAGASPLTGNTDTTGKASFALVAPSTTGSVTYTATAAGETVAKLVNVSSTAVPAARAIASSSLSVNPSVVTVNATGTSNATTVRAVFLDSSFAKIANVRVWFALPDPFFVGGSFGNSGIVLSDETGTATTTYIPGAVSSPTDGVIVLACYSENDFVVPASNRACPPTDVRGNPVRSTQVRLTVIDEALRLSIGTDELIGLGSVTYTKDFVVVVVDAAGRAKADVEITPLIDVTRFYKGFYDWDGERWSRVAGALRLPGCDNEDSNRNGFLDAGEDVNGNGVLDPAGVSITMVGSNRTDAAGKAVVRIEYPRDRATWIDYLITVTGRVGGSEGLAVYRGELSGLGNLPAPGEAFTNRAVFPAFGVSPYGRDAGCTNAR